MQILPSFFHRTSALIPKKTHKTEQESVEHSENLYTKTEYYIQQSRELRAALAKSIRTLRQTNDGTGHSSSES
jgi:hypothetical protein